ncbi:MAG: hydroxymethylglutaryl-CoA lyase [Deinococcus sp.]
MSERTAHPFDLPPPGFIQVVEVGPRDGLQNEPQTLPPALRTEFIRRLAGAGVSELEGVSFVRPDRLPQMAGAEEVLADVRPADVALAGLVLNERGFERARAAGLGWVRYAFPVSEAFAQRNQNSSVGAGLELAGVLVGRAREAGMRVGVVLSTAFGCPFEGPIAPGRALKLAEKVAALSPDELVFADTIGAGGPRAVREVLGEAARWQVAGMRLGGHFHNTRNTGYANALAAVEAGAGSLDASLGGLGGCPFAPRASGNVATEDLAYLLRELGLETGLDLGGLLEVNRWLGEGLGHELPGMLGRAGDFGGPR